MLEFGRNRKGKDFALGIALVSSCLTPGYRR
jgi:hypothetical protein